MPSSSEANPVNPVFFDLILPNINSESTFGSLNHYSYHYCFPGNVVATQMYEMDEMVVLSPLSKYC